MAIDATLLDRVVGASAKEVDLGQRIGRVRFEGAQFAPGAGFDGVTFDSPVSFDGARFDGGARFEHTIFVAGTRFGRARFVGGARFSRAAFASQAWFGGASFAGPTTFELARFSGPAWFGQADFVDDVSFDGTMFVVHADLHGATFRRKATFKRTAFAYDGDRPDAGTGRRRRTGRAAATGSSRQLSSWWRRVAAVVIDGVLLAAVVAAVAGSGWLLEMLEYKDATQVSVVAAPIAGALFALWNLGRQGRRGQTLGKRQMNVAVVRVRDGRPIGVLMSYVRQVAHLLDSALLVGWLWPLWDRRRQTFADKLVGTQAVRRGDVRGGPFVALLGLAALVGAGVAAVPMCKRSTGTQTSGTLGPSIW